MQVSSPFEPVPGHQTGSGDEVDTQLAPRRTTLCRVATLAVAALCLCLLLFAVALAPGHAATSAKLLQLSEEGSVMLSEEEGKGEKQADDAKGNGMCYDAESGDDCHKIVVWHMKDLQKHPKWYGELDEQSTFHDFQEWVHGGSPKTCPRPCREAHQKALAVEDASAGEAGKDDTSAREAGENGKEASMEETSTSASAGDAAADVDALSQGSQETDDVHKCDQDAELLRKLKASGECHRPVEGEVCYASIVYALERGIPKHPDWYAGTGITDKSTFEELQRYLHENHPHSSCCPKACECRTAVEGEKCYDSVIWGMTLGLQNHRDWYQDAGLDENSAFEDWQKYLQESHSDTSGCSDTPCTERPAPAP